MTMLAHLLWKAAIVENPAHYRDKLSGMQAIALFDLYKHLDKHTLHCYNLATPDISICFRITLNDSHSPSPTQLSPVSQHALSCASGLHGLNESAVFLPGK